ncbi:glycerol-3-phosphate transporter, partial [Morganella morganii]|nr:glycerol-3-phosphate transporter [Morganella morganii]
MLSMFKPAPHIKRLSADRLDQVYRRLRWIIFIGFFLGYSAYYSVRENFALAFTSLMEQGFSIGVLGAALSAISITYGLSKFIMGSFSDRANPRY